MSGFSALSVYLVPYYVPTTSSLLGDESAPQRRDTWRISLFSYDLHNQRNYKPVWDLLESWGATRLLESLWVVTLNSTASEVRDALNQKIDGDDSTALIELKSGSVGDHASPESGVDWMKANIS